MNKTLPDLYLQTGDDTWLLNRYNDNCRACAKMHNQDERAGMKPVTTEIKAKLVAKCKEYKPNPVCGAFHLMDNF
jgi:hypothetical protein